MTLNTFTNNRLNEVASTCQKVIPWFEGIDDKNVQEKRNSLEVKLCSLIEEAKTAYDVLPVKTTVGVFGASQAGKSYLVSTLASFGGDDLTATFDGKKVSFFNHMNPIGGDFEATGIVTRFTKFDDKGVSGFPIKVKVFNEADLVKVLINSYNSDLNLKAVPAGSQCDYLSTQNQKIGSTEFLKNFFEDLKSDKYALKDEKSYIHDYDVVSIAKYAIRKSKSDFGDNAKFPIDCYFWSECRKLVSKLNFAGRAKMFSILWNELDAFTTLFTELGKQLLELEGASSVYVPLNCFIEDPNANENDFRRREDGTLLDIGVLKNVFKDKDDPSKSVEVVIVNDGNEIKKTISFASLTFAAREFSFPLPKESNADGFDVLDFPGCRSRKTDEIEKFKDPNTDTTEYLRRGKVGYLFELYCDRHEIDVLLWCVAVSKQQEVLEEQINSIEHWVYENVGRTADERAKFGKIPLIGAFTRFDSCSCLGLDKAKSNERAKEKGDPTVVVDYSGISSKINKALESFHHTWVDEWVKGVPFNQFFFVRKPNIPETDDMYVKEKGKEVDFLPNEYVKTQIEEYKTRISSCPELKYVYHEKDGSCKTINEVLKPSDGGVNYLASFLRENFADYKVNKDRTCDLVLKDVKEIVDALSLYAKREGAKAQKEAYAKGLKLMQELLQCDRVAGTLSYIRDFIEIDKDKAFKDYTDNQSDGNSNNSYRFARALTKMREDNLVSICNGDFFNEIYANLLRNLSEQKRKAILSEVQKDPEAVACYSIFLDNNNQFVSDKDLKERLKSLLTNYTNELSKAYTALKVEDEVIAKLEPYEGNMSSRDALALGQCMRALKLISDFNTYLYVGTLNRESITHVDKDDSDRDFFKENIKYSDPDMCMVPNIDKSLVDNIEDHYYHDYFSVFIELMSVRNLTAESKYNLSATQNNELCSYLDTMEQAAGLA